MTKQCTKCEQTLDIDLFGKNKSTKDGLNHWCKKCAYQSTLDQQRTRRGVIYKIYNSQITSSKKRNHPKPNYSFEEFYEWVINHNTFEKIYLKWVKSKYDKIYVPSIDRKNDFKPYTFDNIKLTIWRNNKLHQNQDILTAQGTSGKCCKTVYLFNVESKSLVKTYHSTAEAGRQIGLCQQMISKRCNEGYVSLDNILFTYSPEPSFINMKQHQNKKRPVNMIDCYGKIVKTFESIAEAVRLTGEHEATIRNNCMKPLPKPKFYWQFK